MSKSDRRIDIEEINDVTVARLLEKKILDEAKKQNQNLEKVIEALREQFPEANL